MRLHRLDLDSFGPYAEPVSIDFDVVSADGLFLIHGPTGSGKTSILDAVCYALYGDLPGNRDKRGIATDHGDGSRPARSELTFTSGEQRLRIRRTGEYDRPKKRGTGTVSVQASVTLERWQTGSWVPLSTRHDETADIINDVLGMGLNQFAQVAMLPQGQFATFLQASPEDRRAVLERLFDTSTFAGIEAWFAEERRRTEASVAGLTADLDAAATHLRDVIEALGSLDQEAVGAILEATPDLDPHSRTHLPEWARGIQAGVQRALSEAVAALDAASLAERAALDERDATQVLADRQSRAREARATLARLRDEEAGRRAIDAALDEHSRAAGMAVPLELARRAVERSERAQADLGVALSALKDLRLDVSAGEADALADVVAGYDSIVAEAAAVHADRIAHEQRTSAALEAAQSLEACLDARRRAVQESARKVEVLAATVKELRSDEERCPGLAADLRRAERALELERSIEADEAQAQKVVEARRTAEAALLAAREALLDLREERLSGMAAELARGLEADLDCPVCGSIDHPRPAEPSGEPVTADALTAAESTVDGARAALQERDLELAELRTRVAERRSEVAALDLQAPAAEQAARARAELAQVEESAGQLEQAVTDLGAAQTRHEASEMALADADNELAAARGAMAAEHDRAVDLARRLTEALESHASCPCAAAQPTRDQAGAETVSDMTTRHNSVAAALRLVTETKGDSDEALDEAQNARDVLDAALAEHGFDSPDQVAAARLEEPEATELRARARRYDDALAAASATIADPDIVAAEAVEPADPGAASARHAAAREAHRRAQEAHGALVPIDSQVQRLGARITSLSDTLAPELDRASLVRTLADSVTGLGADNTLRMRLTSFVLASKLERVVAAANERLATMAGSRFVLEHTDGLARRGARSGLGLRVLDQWTDRARDPSTLSGGETFMVSLALALGLGDAVRHESGGVDLATLFIDEGFGTLDDESLDHVMSTLDDLRDGGRAVGIVSHVSDLRTRISRHLEVRKTPAGSSVLTHTPDSAAPAA